MYPNLVTLILFCIAAGFTPGPNNILGSYSGFNFGVIKTVPHILGVTLGFTALIISLIVGLINVFKLYPLIQEVLKYLGTLFLLYLAFKISFSNSNNNSSSENPVKFVETFFFQFLNPKGVIVGIIVVSTYIHLDENYINYSFQVIILALLFSITSITSWTLVGKFLRKFATNEKFIKYFNYAMAVLLLLSILTFYL